MMRACVAVLSMCWLPSTGSIADTPPAAELLNAYAETQDRLGSFRMTFEQTTHYDAHMIGGPNERRASGRRLRNEYGRRYFDGRRSKYILEVWGDFNADWKGLARKDAVYRSWLWDGRHHFAFVRRQPDSQRSGYVVIGDKLWATPFVVATYGSGEELFGRLAGERERIDVKLRDAGNRSVRAEPDLVDGAPCQVLDAVTSHGRYAIWLDPERGYNIVRAEIRIRAHQQDGKTCPNVWQVLENVRCERVDGLWLPMEADINMDVRWPNGSYTRTQGHHQRIDVLLDVDHGTLGSFETADIDDGAKVYLGWIPGITYVWQAGQVVDETGRVVLNVRTTLPEDNGAQGPER